MPLMTTTQSGTRILLLDFERFCHLVAYIVNKFCFFIKKDIQGQLLIR